MIWFRVENTVTGYDENVSPRRPLYSVPEFAKKRMRDIQLSDDRSYVLATGPDLTAQPDVSLATNADKLGVKWFVDQLREEKQEQLDRQAKRRLRQISRAYTEIHAIAVVYVSVVAAARSQKLTDAAAIIDYYWQRSDELASASAVDVASFDPAAGWP